jgi:ubiquinol-cytochrome c reductase cytochrome c1 subunit
MRKLLLCGAAAVVLGLGAESRALGAETVDIEAPDWSFSGPFGTFDRDALRRGLLVYRGLCGLCHSIRLVAYRDLADIGFSEDEVKAVAAEYQVTDGPNDEGEMYQRPARPADRFVPPFPNEQAARFVNNGALPPDLSVITLAREGGADYIYALLMGYDDPPPDVEMMGGTFYNHAFPGNQIAMAPSLMEGMIEYADGTPATVEQMASDVTAFLVWAAEPKLEERKNLGVKVVLFLIVFTAMLYAVKRKVWRDLH